MATIARHLSVAFMVTLTACQAQKGTSPAPGFVQVENTMGPTLGYVPTSGVTLLEVEGKYFKDLNRNAVLDPYEDWRLSADRRAIDLVARMSIGQIAGLMLYSKHQGVPGGSMLGGSTYDGKTYSEADTLASDLTDQQKDFVVKDNLRHVLLTKVESPAVAASWNNTIQALAESTGLGIPVNISSDPRHGTLSSAEYNLGAGGNISMWPGSLGLAATFDPELVREFGEIASQEYRALGIATALSPQVDLATDPRWSRVSGTFGEDTELVTAMARAYTDGFQSSGESGWGMESVNVMVKHWPGGGTGEGGRDAHFGYGAYAVYPGDNFAEHLQPFVEGAFNLDGGTSMASAVMPYYTISYGQGAEGENVANAYSNYLIGDLLRKQYGYDGVVCTDWGVTWDATSLHQYSGRPWGVENLTEVERHYLAIMAGVDQFGGNNEAAPVIGAYDLGVAEMGENWMRWRFEKSAVRLLKNIFRTGLFENPYLDPSESQRIVGNPEFMQAGYEAQLKSMVMLKNQGGVLPLDEGKKVYIPERIIPETEDWFGKVTPSSRVYPTNSELANRYFEVTADPQQADFALVMIESPESGVGYDARDREQGGNGYLPISLQYQPYVATTARETSMAGGGPFETFTNRSYRGKRVKTANATDLDLVKETKALMGDKPVIVVLRMAKPAVMAEFEPDASAILVDFDVQHQAIFDILSGRTEPSGRLPLQMPATMETVETQYEDVPHDIAVYVDSQGNRYDFGFGLNFSGVIREGRID